MRVQSLAAVRQRYLERGECVVEIRAIGLERQWTKRLTNEDREVLAGARRHGEEAAHADRRFECMQQLAAIGIEAFCFLHQEHIGL